MESGPTDQPIMTLPELDADASRHPQAMYRELRENSPVLSVEGIGVLVARHDDVERVLQDPGAFSSEMSAAPLGNIRPLIPLQIDPPAQRRYRRLLDPLFAPKRMQALEPSITAVADELIDAIIGEREIDFTKAFSIPYPSRVFLSMFGLPVDELDTFLTMKDGIIRANEIVGGGPRDAAATAHRDATAQAIYSYFDLILAERSREPRDDLLSYFLAAESDGERLTQDEILDICFLFLIAGLDTVTASLDCFFGYLVDQPAQRDRIVADPSLIPAVVEELLRWETPVPAVARIAVADTEIQGCPISAGDHVLALIGSANTDTDHLDDADVVRWDRDISKHYAFGIGVHRCLGSHLARIELRVALRRWHARIPRYRLAPGAKLRHSEGVRALDAFPMLIGDADPS